MISGLFYSQKLAEARMRLLDSTLGAGRIFRQGNIVCRGVLGETSV